MISEWADMLARKPASTIVLWSGRARVENSQRRAGGRPRPGSASAPPVTTGSLEVRDARCGQRPDDVRRRTHHVRGADTSAPYGSAAHSLGLEGQEARSVHHAPR